MSESLFLRIKSLNVKTMHGVSSAKNVIKVAAMHNLREIVAEFGVRADSHIDLARVALNYQLRGPATAAGVADLALALLNNASVHKLRKDACMALEVVFSLPPGSAVDHREFFGAAVVWADAFFNVPILSAAVHLDEAAPHCHVLLLPLVGGRMKGGALAGGPTKIKMMLSDFQQQVGQRFGLTHQPRAKRLSKTSRDAAGRMVLDALKSHPERFNVPAVRDVLVAALGAHHETLLPLLGLALPTPAKRKEKSFAAMMTAPCKPEPTARRRTSIDVAISTSIDVGLHQAAVGTRDSATSMLCIDVALPVQAFPHDFHHRLATAGTAPPVATSPSSAGRTAPTSASAAPAAGGHVETVNSAQPGGVCKISDTPKAVHQLDTPATDDVHELDGTAAAPGQADVSISPHISTLTTCPAKPTDYVALVEQHHAGACRPAAKDALSFERISPAADAAYRSPEYFAQQQATGAPSNVSRPKPDTTDRAPCANGMRPHRDVSKSGYISQGGGISPPPAGVLSFEQSHAEGIPNSGDTPTARSNLLKTQQVDHRAADHYQRHRDDDQPAETWCADLGEFVQATGPPPCASRHRSPEPSPPGHREERTI